LSCKISKLKVDRLEAEALPTLRQTLTHHSGQIVLYKRVLYKRLCGQHLLGIQCWLDYCVEWHDSSNFHSIRWPSSHECVDFKGSHQLRISRRKHCIQSQLHGKLWEKFSTSIFGSLKRKQSRRQDPPSYDVFEKEREAQSTVRVQIPPPSQIPGRLPPQRV
jgi:hypothetical protein